MKRIALALVLAACSHGSTEQSTVDLHASHDLPNTNPDLGGWAPVFQNVRLTITAPAKGSTVPTGDVHVSFELANYPLSQPGPHIHLIVDDQPYIAVYDASKGYDLKGLAPGAHVLRAFPSRPWHESIKSSPQAFDALRFVVDHDDGKFPVDFNKPLFTYSRPKGTYEGKDAQRIMFDWYLRNIELSPGGNRVKYLLDGKEAYLDQWKPIWWEGLPAGEHTVAAGLVDAQGNVIENGGLNWTERKFTLK